MFQSGQSLRFEDERAGRLMRLAGVGQTTASALVAMIGNGHEFNGSDLSNRKRHFLVYSSFATSALVAPHESMVEFWQRAFVADLIRRFASGPALTDPRSPLPEGDHQRILNLWQGLLATLVSRYAAIDNDRLDAILTEIEERRDAWHSFWEPIEQTMRLALHDTGIRGAIALCDLLGPPNVASAPPESLPRQRLFLINGQQINEENRAQWRKLLAQQGGFGEQAQQIASGFGDVLMMAFNPRQARERAKDMATRKARSRLYQRRDATERAVVEYGNAIKDLVAANIFPGDMLWKNFGVTRHGKVVFYDYDEIEYLSDCNFRKVPEPRTEEEEMSGEVWYHVGARDVFPETFGPFLLGDTRVREVFMKHHADLLDVAFWQGHKERIQAGHVHDVFPYDQDKRFRRHRQSEAEAAEAGI